MIRKIIHVDMDAFYASVEQRDNPFLQNKPVAVGGDGLRSVVAAASYEARKYGVHSAMSSVVARKKCPHLIIVSPRFDIYKKVSLEIRKIFFEYTGFVEPLSLDEAFLDVTGYQQGKVSATDIAVAIKEKIKRKTGLTASAGISINKFLAKLASDYKKPDGLFVIKPQQAEKFVEDLTIEKFYGIGKVTAEKMHKMGIVYGRDLKKIDLTELVRLFGKPGKFYYNIARAIDDRPVEPDRERKSIGTEITFEADLFVMDKILYELKAVENELVKRISKSGAYGRTLTLKIKFEDFEQITRSKSLPKAYTPELIHITSVELISAIQFRNKGIRLLGLTVSNFDKDDPSPFQTQILFE